jgi:hypothetical protein
LAGLFQKGTDFFRDQFGLDIAASYAQAPPWHALLPLRLLTKEWPIFPKGGTKVNLTEYNVWGLHGMTIGRLDQSTSFKSPSPPKTSCIYNTSHSTSKQNLLQFQQHVPRMNHDEI